ncbi:DUF4265 domain-containing protein [Streptomyces virginiae]|uniref:DUF4265 domain-containing protein n=1 Tax=Streptomyces virginiae TaxID=1961 RepID=UPI00366312C2
MRLTTTRGGRATRRWSSTGISKRSSIPKARCRQQLKPLDDGTFSIACIPFQTYGLALGDRVRLSANDQVSGVMGFSAHRVLRMLLVPAPDPKQLTESIDRIRTGIDTAGLLSVWNGDRHVAVDIPPGTHPSTLFDITQREVSEGRAFWEWADAMPFSAHR